VFKGIHHTSISTPDLERLATFYRDVLGFKECTRYGWPVGSHGLDKVIGVKGSSGEAVMLKAGNSIIEITQYLSPPPTPADPERLVTQHGISHFCFDVSDLDGEYERLLAAGVVFHTKPRFVSNGASKITYMRDPDGNVIELQEIIERDQPIMLDWM
jgi:catechol 2,3-dioxygenase-like lactoylglutathione lyase family enzyme